MVRDGGGAMTARQNFVPAWFGLRLKRHRERQGWSMRRLGSKTGLNEATICRTEAGHDVALSTAIAYSSALGLSLDALLTAPSCNVCDDMPPAGYSCSACVREGDA